MKSFRQRIFGLINTLFTGTLAVLLIEVYIGGMDKNSRCEYCGLMIYPALFFILLALPGIFTLFCNINTLTKRKTMLNTLNIIGILLSISAVIFNFMASGSNDK